MSFLRRGDFFSDSEELSIFDSGRDSSVMIGGIRVDCSLMSASVVAGVMLDLVRFFFAKN